MDARRSVSFLSSFFALTGLFLLTRKMAQVARRLKPPFSIQIAGPPGAGKKTLFRYLRHDLLGQEGRIPRRHVGRVAAELAGITTYYMLSTVSDEVLHTSPTSWRWRFKHKQPDGLIVIIDTHNPEAEHAYLERLYESYRARNTQTQPDKLRAMLILLNKFDLWGSTADVREAAIDRYRGKIFQDLVNRFRSSFGVTVQWGCVSLTQPEHAPFNNLILNEFLTVLAQRR